MGLISNQKQAVPKHYLLGSIKYSLDEGNWEKREEMGRYRA